MNKVTFVEFCIGIVVVVTCGSSYMFGEYCLHLVNVTFTNTMYLSIPFVCAWFQLPRLVTSTRKGEHVLP